MERRETLKTMSLAFGYALTPTMLTGLLSSCSKDAVVNWQPKFFTVQEAYAVEQLANVIIPTTDISGAKEVNAHVFVDLYLADVAQDWDQKKTKKGAELWIKAFETKANKSLGNADEIDFEENLKSYFGVDAQEQSAIKALLNKQDSGNEEDKYYIYSFLFKVKELTLMGFYASEQIGENVLTYLPVPGKFEGCIPLADVGNSYSL